MASSFHNRVLAFDPLAGFQPMSDEEEKLQAHIQQILLNLSIASQNLDETIRRRKNSNAR
jgi:hypothetical protein